MNLKNIPVPFKNYVAISLFISLATVILVFILRNNNLPPQVPLFYGLAEGEEQIAPSILLTVPSLVSIIILLINIALSLLIEDEFLKKTLIAAGVATTFFSLVTTLKIIFLVGSF